jgi:hypothetical protein
MRPGARPGASIRRMATERSRPAEMTAGRALELLIIGSLLFWPRLFILGFVLFSWQILMDAFSSWVIWVGGFFLLPWTTFAYMAMWSISSDVVSGVEWVFVGGALLLDLFAWWALFRK